MNLILGLLCFVLDLTNFMNLFAQFYGNVAYVDIDISYKQYFC